jgi:hypothetical protein
VIFRSSNGKLPDIAWSCDYQVVAIPVLGGLHHEYPSVTKFGKISLPAPPDCSKMPSVNARERGIVANGGL